MSRASDRKRMIEGVAGYSLMSVPEVAAVLGAHPDTVHEMIADGSLPSVTVGKRAKCDPIDVAVHVLAGKEGVAPGEYWAKYGDAVVARNARRYFLTAGVFMGAA